jgi:hypothetical protein
MTEKGERIEKKKGQDWRPLVAETGKIHNERLKQGQAIYTLCLL